MPGMFQEQKSGTLGEDSPWVRPLGDVEKLFAGGGRLGTFNTVVAVWMETRVSLEESTLEQATRAWFRYLLEP